MSNGSIVSADLCNEEYYYEISEEANFVANFICTPIYFFVGLFGNIVFLTVVFTRSKTERPYLYQVFVAVGELLYVIAQTARVLIVEWTYPSYRPDVILPVWWWTCYGCVWYSAHLAIAIPSVISTYVEFLNIFMLLDRLGALRKGIQYKPPTKYSYIGVVAACIVLGAGINSDEFYSYRVEGTGSNGSLYKINYNSVEIPAAVYTTYVRSIVLCMVLLLGYSLSAIIPVVYRRHLRKSKQLFTTEQETMKRRKLRTLMAIAMCQTVTQTIYQTLFIFRSLYPFLPIQCPNSRKQLFVVVCNLGMQVLSACNFYVMIVISKEFRRDVAKLFKKNNQLGGTSNIVVPNRLDSAP